MILNTGMCQKAKYQIWQGGRKLRLMVLLLAALLHVIILEEAFLGIQELGAKTAMPIHWGAFRLSSHPWDDSATRLVKAAENSDVVIATPMLGETMNLDDVHECQIRWYEDIR